MQVIYQFGGYVLVQNKPHIQFKLVLVLCVKIFFKVKNTNAMLLL